MFYLLRFIKIKTDKYNKEKLEEQNKEEKTAETEENEDNKIIENIELGNEELNVSKELNASKEKTEIIMFIIFMAISVVLWVVENVMHF